MAYFSIMQGLRGCYMPDSAYIIRADTRRELKKALQWEADSLRDAGAIGLNKRSIAWLANAAWKARKRSGEYVAPYRFAGQHAPGNWCMGLFACPSTRADYLAQEES